MSETRLFFLLLEIISSFVVEILLIKFVSKNKSYRKRKKKLILALFFFNKFIFVINI